MNSRSRGFTLIELLVVISIIALSMTGSWLPAMAYADGGTALRKSVVRLAEAASRIEVYDYIELTLSVDPPSKENPFKDAEVIGEFTDEQGQCVRVDGFCDTADGSIYRVRFMPRTPGRYTYRLTYRQDEQDQLFVGEFVAVDGQRRGLLRVDPEKRWHFIWEGTGEHYFWNGTTTYYLMGWDDATIRKSIERLHRLRINRLRVLLYGRSNPRPWEQPVVPTENFKLHLNPWPAERPDDIENPGFDLTRFNVEHWQKYERLLRYAREKDMIISVIFFIYGEGGTPFKADSEEELLYYRYAVARFAAFANVTWDLGNEYNAESLRQAPQWADRMGHRMKQWDPYDHLTSAHNVAHRTPRSTWLDMQLIQRWDSGQNAFMLGQRQAQEDHGYIIPQINEEYGYEDLWEENPGQRSAETRRKLAWEIYMAGCYQTTGESARRGTGVPPDTGGGWVNGRGDDTMTMLLGYGHIVDFFTAFDWWNCRPLPEAVEGPASCLGKSGELYILYFREGGRADVKLTDDQYRGRWYNPRTGEWDGTCQGSGPVWTTPPTPDDDDWVLWLQKDDTLQDKKSRRIDIPASSRISIEEHYWKYNDWRVLLLGGWNHGHNPHIDHDTQSGDGYEDEDGDHYGVSSVEQITNHMDELVDAGGNVLRCVLDPAIATGGQGFPFCAKSGSKYDLDRMDGGFWIRLDTFLAEAEKRDIVVQLEIWDRFDMFGEVWSDFSPFNPANNVNYTTEQSALDTNYKSFMRHPFLKGVPGHSDYESASASRQAQYDVVRKYQEKFIDKLLSITRKHGNILYCMNNETHEAPEWGQYWIQYIKREMSKQGQSILATDMLVDIDPERIREIYTSEVYDYVDASQLNQNLPGDEHWKQATGIAAFTREIDSLVHMTKAYGSDEEMGRWTGDSDNAIEEMWRSLLAGVAGVRFHRPPWGLGLSERARNCLQAVRKIESRVKFWDVEPTLDPLTNREENEAYLAADRGEAYILYFTAGGTGTVGLDLTDYPDAKFNLSWVSIDSGEWGDTATITGGSTVTITKLGAGHWAAAIVRQGD